MLHKRRSVILIVALLAIAGPLLMLNGCGTTFPRRNPTGEIFPTVQGETLKKEAVRLPGDFAGKPVLLLVGYEQNTQFDLDRWLLGLTQAKLDVTVREVPTIPGLLPGLFAGAIDSGMRSGIPDEDWGTVITVYRDAGKIAEFTGNEGGLPGRVLLLDGDGRVAFFHDEGYSVGALLNLQQALERVTNQPHGPQ